MNTKPVAFILAAGLGNRLRPSTQFCPKPLIPLAGVEPLYFSLFQFYKLGIDRVIINVHHLQTMIFKAVDSWRSHFPNMDIRISNESSKLLGTGGAILKVLMENQDFVEQRGLLVQNGDTVGLFPREEVFQNPTKSCFAVSSDKSFLEKYGPLWVGDKKQWVGIGRQAKSANWLPAHFLGFHYLSPEVTSLIPKFCGEVRPVDLFNGIYRPLSDIGIFFEAKEFSFSGSSKACFWFDITNKNYLLEAQTKIMDKLSSWGWDEVLKSRYPGIEELSEGVWVLRQGLELSAVSWGRPAIFINTSSQKGVMTKLKMGSSSCWIQEKSNLSLIEEDMSLTNSIVCLKKEASSKIPKSVDDEILLA